MSVERQQNEGPDQGRKITTLEDVKAAFPSWDVWERNGSFYGKPPTPPIAWSNTPGGLAEQIGREIAAMESRWPAVSAQAHGP